MKKFLMLIITTVIVLSALAVMAQDEKSYTITPRLAYNYLTDGDVRDAIGAVYGVTVDFDMAKYPVGLETGYLYGEKHGNSAYSIPFLVTYKYPINDVFYARAGAGFAYNKAEGEDSNTAFAWEIKAGYKFSTNWSAELGYVDYGDVVDGFDSSSAAIQASVGYAF